MMARRRGWRFVGVLAVGATVVAGATASIIALTAQPALAVCSSDSASCVDTAGAAPSIAVVPVQHGGPTLSVRNDGAGGSARVGVLGWFTAVHPTRGTLIRSSDDQSQTVAVQRGARRDVRLADVPVGATAVLLQVGGTASGSDCGASCGSASVAFVSMRTRLPAPRLRAALERWAERTATPLPTAATVADLASTVGNGVSQPAHLAAAIGAGDHALRVGWQLDAGTEAVSAVRVVRTGRAVDGSMSAVSDQPARSGTTSLDGLVPGRSYTISVAPLIDGEVGAAITLTAAPLGAGEAPPASAAPDDSPSPTQAPSPSPDSSSSPDASASLTPQPGPDSAPASHAATSASPSPSAGASVSPSAAPSTGSAADTGIPATPAGWKPIFTQTFNKEASVGSFESVYPGWSGYDGGTDTSHTTSRPADRTGLWNNRSTVSVHDGVFDCRVHTQGVRPQVCALTPVVDGSAWSGQTYGRYSVRFKTDPVPGYKIAWLLWPSSDNWSQGEVDFPEGSLDGTITGSVHNATGNPSQNAYWIDTRTDPNHWRTATIEWKPGRVTFTLDDQSWTTTASSGIPQHPMRWALQTETEIQSQAPDPSASGHVLIDWLAGYSYTG